jgi:uncharacterized protein YndB with AHSA1/START domain
MERQPDGAQVQSHSRLTAEALGEGHSAEAVAALLPATAERSLTITHRFHAPRALVWQAWTDPVHIPHWWGPVGTSYEVRQMEVREGGIWHYVQVEPPGEPHTFYGLYHTVEPMSRLLHTFEYEGAPGEVMVEQIRFVEEGGDTIVEDTMIMASSEALQAMVGTGMEEGAVQTFQRLAALLERLAA